ncbi:hypothetical protein L6164_036448 [Bauhinia variegata]|uniref:Uncharacterized protein n=1 Tax=Bauhinia variegata TaxID=167791 RepID=A0ACB9KH93_BAUVA|nr:hypothetical protein L6164_036448 [Bauhinia variegata]
MEETRSLPVIEEEEIGDEFYEKIEAPKFVDFTAPDILPPHDDRYWFCMRFGCDQKHEEELDFEAINKNFVLRVMAARSPNVRLRKVLLKKKEGSENLKCPLTAPAKSSKSRVSRLALISSVSQKMTGNNAKPRPLSKISATPNAKVKQSLAKALTTPRNRKSVSKLEQFRSVQNKKPMNVAEPKNRVVVKALVFRSPKKVVKVKSSVELKTPMKSLCSAMKKLELNNVKKNAEGNNKPLPVTASRKQCRGREVKSRVFDSLYLNRSKVQETSSRRCLKEKKKVKHLKENRVLQPPEAAENYSSDLEIDEKSRAGSLAGCLGSDASKGVDEVSMGAVESQQPNKRVSSTEASSHTSGGDDNSLPISAAAENKTSEECEHEEKSKLAQEKEKMPEAAKKRCDKENALASDDKENEGELTENDDKENAPATDENRELNVNHEHLKRTILRSKHEDSRNTQKKPTSTATGPQALKYKKPKPTNPKPFKFRTDERGILKEANLERKRLSPLKETTARGSKVVRKLQNVTKQLEYTDKVTKKSQVMQSKLVRPRGALSSKREKVFPATSSGNLSAISETSSNILQPKEAAKPSGKATDASSRSCSRGRRATTTPKEPKFHSLHVPKSCTRKLI